MKRGPTQAQPQRAEVAPVQPASEPAGTAASALLGMQRRAGNRAVTAVVQRTQPSGGRHVAHTKTPHTAQEVTTALGIPG